MPVRGIASSIASAVASAIGKSTGSLGQAASLTATNVFYSPYNWYSDGGGSLQSNNIKAGSTYAITNTPGAYLKTKFSGTSFSIDVDVSALTGASVLAANYPAIEYSVDGGAWTRTQLASSSTTISIATGLSQGIHTVEIIFVGVMWSTNDRWTTPVMALKITGISVDSGKLLYSPTIKPKRAMFFGDSHSEGYEAGGVGTTVANQNARLAWPRLLADYLDAEYGVAGFAGQGYTVGGGGSVPNCQSAWNLYSSGKSRLTSGDFTPTADYIISGHGTNDSDDSTLSTAVQATAEAWAAVNELTAVFILLPPSNGKRTRILAASSAAGVIGVDTNTDYMTGGNVNGSHLSSAGHIAYSDGVWSVMEPLVSTISAPANTVAPSVTGSASPGGTLTCSTGTWSGFPLPSYTYQWKNNGSSIPGETANTYSVVSGDLGDSISCTVTATNSQGASSATSNSQLIVESGIALVGSTFKVGNSSTGTTSDAVDTTGANLLIATATWYGTTPSSITDSKGNTWTKLTTSVSTTDQNSAIWYCVPTSVGSGHTITITNVYTSIGFMAFSGASATPFDSEDTSSSASSVTSLALGPLTIPAGGLIIATLGNFTHTGTVSISDSLTANYQPYSAGTAMTHGSAYKLSAGGETITPTWSWSGGQGSVVGAAAVFKKA
jgi:hypothetical protein